MSRARQPWEPLAFPSAARQDEWAPPPTSASRCFRPSCHGELAIKVQAGKLELPLPPLDYCLSLARRHRLTWPREGLDAALLCAAAELPLIYRDPFDRNLVALAIREQMAVLTPGRTIPLYPVATIW
jgi:PIN domain nuclease of toxin-antitoxin system